MYQRLPISAAAPCLLLVFAVAVSVGVHVGAITAAKDRSLGAFGQSNLRQMPQSLAVERIADDWLPKAQTLTDPALAEQALAPPAETDLDLPDPEQAVEEVAFNEPTDPPPLEPPAAQDLVQLATVKPPDFTLSDLPPTPVENPVAQDVLAALAATDINGLALHQPETAAFTELPLPELLPTGQGGHTGSDNTLTETLNLPEALAPTTPDTVALDSLFESRPPSLESAALVPPAPTTTGSDLLAALPPALPLPSAEQTLTAQAQWLPTIQLDDAFDYDVRHHLSQEAPHHFTVRISPRPQELQVLDPMPKDVLFLLDTSSSIAKSVVREVFAGVSRGLETLNPQDRFNIAVFNRETQLFSESLWAPATTSNKQSAEQFLRRIVPGGSQTDVNQALSTLLSQSRKDAGRVMNVIIVSDGKPTQGVTNSKDLINQITRQNNRIASVYCVAVTSKPNTYLLDYLAYRNGGRSIQALDSAHVANNIATLCSQLRYPLIRDVSLSIIGSGARDVHPIALSDIHLGQPFSIYGRFEALGPFTVRIAGSGLKHGKVQPVDFTFVRDLRESQPGPIGIEREWAFWRLYHLYSEQIRQGTNPRLQQEIKAIEKRSRSLIRR